PMAKTKLFIMVITAKKVFIIAYDVFGDIGIEIIVFIPGKIPAFCIYGPGFGFSSMFQKLISRVYELQIVRHHAGSGHPIVIELIYGGTIVPGGIGLKVSFAF